MNMLNRAEVPPRESLAALLEGNQRFIAGQGTANLGFRADLVGGQNPFAVVVGCSDSRVPAEIVFDVGLGDLFVVRVAGNIVAPSQVGSVEFAVSKFGVRLVMVMGHTRCGAVEATLESLQGAQVGSQNIASIIARIAPHIRDGAALEPDPKRRMEIAVKANVRATVAEMMASSPLLHSLSQTSRVEIIGAVYAVETGNVTVLE